MPEWRPYDYSRSRAVLVGASEYESLQDLPAALNSLNRMYGLLTGPLCGWPADRVDLMVNERGHRNLPDSLITSFEDAAAVIAHAGTASSGANITSSKLKQLYTQPGGVPGEVAVGLQSGSGTRQALLGMFGEHASDETPAGACPSPSENPVSYRSCSEDSYAKALAFINGTPYSIGYVAVDQDDKEGHPAGGYTDVSVLSIDGYAPTQENVHLGTYKFAAAEHLYVSPQPSPLAKSFLTFLPQYLAQHQNQWLDYLPCSSVPHTSESVKSLYTDCER